MEPDWLRYHRHISNRNGPFQKNEATKSKIMRVMTRAKSKRGEPKHFMNQPLPANSFIRLKDSRDLYETVIFAGYASNQTSTSNQTCSIYCLKIHSLKISSCMHHIVPIGAKFDFQPLDASNLVLRLHPVSQSVIFHLTYTHMSSEQCKVLTTAQYGPKPLAILRFI